MPDPRSQTALDNARVQSILVRFWSCYDDAHDQNALQTWTEACCRTNCKVMDLSVNHRSGGDIWYSDLLTSCREGNLSMSDWQFLHGLPTSECGSWLTRQKLSMCGSAQCKDFTKKTELLRLESPEKWWAEVDQFECSICVRERKRRYRVLPSPSDASSTADAGAAHEVNSLTVTGDQATRGIPVHLQVALGSSRFKECLFITRCSETRRRMCFTESTAFCASESLTATVGSS